MTTPTPLHRLARGVFLLAIVAFTLPAARAQNADDILLRDMNAKVREIKQRALATDNYDVRLAAQREIMQVMQDTAPLLSEKVRPIFVVSMKVLTPMSEQGAAYTQMIADWSASGEADFTTMKDNGEIAARVARIDRMAEANEALITRFNRFEDDVMGALKDYGIAADQRQAFLEGLRETLGRQIGPMRAIRTFDRELFLRYKSVYALIEQRHEHVKRDDAGQFIWEVEEDGQTFQRLLAEIMDLATRQSEAEKLLSSRL